MRRIGSDGLIHTVAGSLVAGYGGDGGLAVGARLYHPDGIVVADDGSFYIADTENHRIRRVDRNGIITTFAGTGEPGYSGDGGPATSAQFDYPTGLALAADGSLYVADSNSAVIRRVGADGIVTTVAGNGVRASSGDGGPATQAALAYPYDLAFSPEGSLYILDYDSFNIRRLRPDGTIGTVAGTGEYGYGGDGGSPLEATFAGAAAMAFAPDGTLYVADSDNHRVRAFNALLPPKTGDLTGHTAAFRVVADSGLVVKRIEADFDGDGAVDLVATDSTAPLQHRYPGPGVYTAKFSIVDLTGSMHSATLAVVIRDFAEVDAMLRGVFTMLLERLKGGDIARALNTVTGGMREKYQAVFDALQPDLATVVERIGVIQGGTIGAELAEYVVVRSQGTQAKAFLVYLIRSEDGLWRIDGM